MKLALGECDYVSDYSTEPETQTEGGKVEHGEIFPRRPVLFSSNSLGEVLLTPNSSSHVLLLLLFCFETGFHYVAQSGLQLSILLPLPPQS
jgi:hypothetical protein